MHRYTVESASWRAIPWWLLILVGISILLSWGISSVVSVKPLAPFINGLSPFVILGGLYGAFDRWVWKWPMLYRLNIVDTPNLNGRWAVTITSSLRNDETLNGLCSIHQTLGRISVTIDSGVNSSFSVSGSVKIINECTAELTNQYRARRKVQAPEDFNDHEGTNRIFISLNVNRGTPTTGDFYTDHNRQTYGHLEFSETSDEPH